MDDLFKLMQIFCLVIMGIVMFFGITVFFGAPYVPSLADELRKMFKKLYPLNKRIY